MWYLPTLVQATYIHELFRASEGGKSVVSLLGKDGDGTPYFSKRLYDEICKEIVAQEFPLRPGSYKDLLNPHLELLKQVIVCTFMCVRVCVLTRMCWTRTCSCWSRCFLSRHSCVCVCVWFCVSMLSWGVLLEAWMAPTEIYQTCTWSCWSRWLSGYSCIHIYESSTAQDFFLTLDAQVHIHTYVHIQIRIFIWCSSYWQSKTKSPYSYMHTYIHTYIHTNQVCHMFGLVVKMKGNVDVHTYAYIRTYNKPGVSHICSGCRNEGRRRCTHIHIHTYTYIHTYKSGMPHIWSGCRNEGRRRCDEARTPEGAHGSRIRRAGPVRQPFQARHQTFSNHIPVCMYRSVCSPVRKSFQARHQTFLQAYSCMYSHVWLLRAGAVCVWVVYKCKKNKPGGLPVRCESQERSGSRFSPRITGKISDRQLFYASIY